MQRPVLGWGGHFERRLQETLHGIDVDLVEVSDAAPPVLRLTVRMLDAADLSELAQTCCDGVVELCAAQRATLVGEDGRIWAEAEVASDPVGETASMSFRICAESPTAEICVVLPKGPDLPVLRGQLLDLVAVARRAWRARRMLTEESKRAREDALTGLDNRRAIEESLEQAFELSIANGTPLTVMLVDLDNFKRVNDTYGHSSGDDVLRLAASCFRAHLRPTDLVCRHGGDEFIIALPGLPAERGLAVAQRLRRAFSEDIRARGTTMTIGIADLCALGPGSCSVSALLELADASLYSAKRAGRDRVHQATAQRRVG